LLQGKGEAAHEAAVAANVAMLMRLHGEEDLKANAQKFWMCCAAVRPMTE
jgi:anthranilate synthase/phosphoribosyltransferase